MIKLRHLILITTIILAAVLRFHDLGQESFWHDEAYAALFARGSVMDVIQRLFIVLQGANLRFLSHHLSYLFISFMYNFGSSEFILLFPGVLFSLASIWLTYQVGQLLFNKATGLTAAFLLAISPFHLYYSQELIYYPYLVFLSLLTYWTFNVVIQKSTLKNFFLFLIPTILNFLTHLTASFVFFGEAIFAGVFIFPRIPKIITFLNIRLKKYKVLLIVSLILFSLLFWRFLPGIKNFLFLWIRPGKEIPGLEFNWPFFVGGISLFTTTNAFVLLLYLGFFLLGIFPVGKSRRSILFCAVLLLFPLFWLYFAGLNYFFDWRFVIFLLPVFLLVVSFGFMRFACFLLSRLAKGNSRQRVLGCAIWLIGAGVFFWGASPEINHFYQIRRLRFFVPYRGIVMYGMVDDFRGLAQFLEKNAKDDELIVIDQNLNMAGFMYYFRGKSHFVSYNFEKKPLFLNKLGYKGQGWFVCHENCLMEEIMKKDAPALEYVEKETFLGSFTVYQIIPRKNLVFVADMDKFSQNNNWQITPDNHRIFSEPLRIDSYFPWEGRRVKTYNLFSAGFGAEITYEIKVPKGGVYNLYVNMSDDSSSQNLAWQIDRQRMSSAWREFTGRKSNLTKDFVGREVFLQKGKHTIRFMSLGNQAPVGIHYFFFAPKSD